MVRGLRDHDFLQTVEAVYSAGLQGTLWPEALCRIANLFGAVGSTLEVFDKRSASLQDFRFAGLPDGAEIPYVDHYARHNPRAAYAMRHLSERILFDYRLTDERGMDCDPYYVEYLASIDLRYFITGQIVDTPDLHGVISVQRSQRQGHVEARDIALMERLLPHLHRAYDMSLRLRRADRAEAALETILESLAEGAALVGREGRVYYANETLRSFLRRNDGVGISNGALEFASVDATRRFALSLAAIDRLSRGVAGASSTEFLAGRSTEGPAYRISVRPLGASTHLSSVAEAAAIVFVFDPLQERNEKADVLRNVFRFTNAELNVALALQAGTSPIEYARRLGVSSNTVYTHLRRIKEKTSCRRQAELIRRLNDAVATHQPRRSV